MTPQEYADWLSSPAAEQELKRTDPRNPEERLRILEELLVEAHTGCWGDEYVASEIIRRYKRMTSDFFFGDTYTEKMYPV